MPLTPAAAFVAEHHRLIHHVVQCRVRRSQDRDDVVGEVALAIMRNFAFDPARGKPGTYISVVLRSVLSHRRDRARALCRRGTTVSADGLLLADPAAHEPGDVVAAREAVARITSPRPCCP